jgi:cytidine deaminase
VEHGASHQSHRDDDRTRFMPQSVTEDDLKRLAEAAKEASLKAYCPYSRFRVGAAVLTDGGDIVAGCNVENASYGLTICAERNAVFQAVARGPIAIAIKAVAVYTPTSTPTAPCGACRQVINEFGPDAVVVSVCDGPETIRTSLSKLLPQAFGPNNLEPEAEQNLGKMPG